MGAVHMPRVQVRHEMGMALVLALGGRHSLPARHDCLLSSAFESYLCDSSCLAAASEQISLPVVVR